MNLDLLDQMKFSVVKITTEVFFSSTCACMWKFPVAYFSKTTNQYILITMWLSLEGRNFFFSSKDKGESLASLVFGNCLIILHTWRPQSQYVGTLMFSLPITNKILNCTKHVTITKINITVQNIIIWKNIELHVKIIY